MFTTLKKKDLSSVCFLFDQFALLDVVQFGSPNCFPCIGRPTQAVWPDVSGSRRLRSKTMRSFHVVPSTKTTHRLPWGNWGRKRHSSTSVPIKSVWRHQSYHVLAFSEAIEHIDMSPMNLPSLGIGLMSILIEFKHWSIVNSPRIPG